MNPRIAIIAAGGESRRTGLSEYATKAAFRLGGRSLLGHQIDFARRSGCARIFVVCRPHHVRVLSAQLSAEDLAVAAFVLSDRPTGWAGEVGRAIPHVDVNNEVLLLSCDNLHHAEAAIWPSPGAPGLHTYTAWDRDDAAPEHVLARASTVWGEGEEAWIARSGRGFRGVFFSGYTVCRGGILQDALAGLPFIEGKKEMADLLARMSRTPGWRSAPYPGKYDDIADLPSLARIAARLRGDPDGPVDVGAGVLISDVAERVFLTEREDGRGWCPPGGLVDTGERYAHAAIRELREEAGIDVGEDSLRLLGVYPSRAKGGGPGITVMFSCRLDDPVSRMRYHANPEVKQVGWFTREEAQALTIPFGLAEAVEDHFAGRELDCR